MTIVEELDASPEALAALILSLPAGRRPVLLDSCGDAPPDARLLIAACDPFALLGSGDADDPLALLERALARYRLPPVPGGYPAGAAVGTLSYDLGRRYERLPSTAGVDASSPDASIALYDCLLLHDYAAKRTLLVSTGLPEAGAGRVTRARTRARELRGMLGGGAVRGGRGGGGSAGPPVSNFDPDAYAAAVRRVQEHILAGDVYQVNLTQRFAVRLGALEPPELFWRLREHNPAAFAGYLAEPGRTVVSTSPERFLRVQGRRAEMWPIKGTRPRGASAGEDVRLAAALAASAKDRAENLMIVDLARNDLGRVAEYGSVRVDELFGVRALPTVFHMVSRVSAVLRPDTGGCDLLRAAFPCGSITGAPKIRAMEIIEELEKVRRGLSMGAIGYASFDGQMDWNVAIRTLEIAGGIARFNVGGGVVADSDPALEYEESLWKARAILEALGGEGGGRRRKEGGEMSGDTSDLDRGRDLQNRDKSADRKGEPHSSESSSSSSLLPPPSSLIWMNGAVTALAEARVSPASAGVLYGWGVFTTLGVAAGRARAFDQHWERLIAHARRADVPVEWPREAIEGGTGELIGRLGVVDGRARVTLVRSGGGPWRKQGSGGGDAIVFAAPGVPREPRPLALTVSPYRLNTSSPLVGVKSTAYVGHLFALEEARGRGFDEALMLNERGEVAEATAANVFWVRGGELFTPSLATGCLAGVTRRLVLEAAERRRVRVTEGSFALAMLGEADELFLTSSSRGLSAVGELDIHRYGPAPILARLAADVEKMLG